MVKLTEAELRKLIAGGENTILELKLNVPRPSEMAQRICGLANGQGGYIVIGVEDKNLRLVGIRNIGEAVDGLLRAARLVEPSVEFSPYEPEIYVLDERNILVAYVPSSAGEVYQAGGACWLRQGTNTLPMSVQQIMKAARDRGKVQWELDVASDAEWEDIDIARVEAYLKQRQDSYRFDNRYLDIQQLLEGMRCGVLLEGKFRPTNGGLLFFGRDPQLHIPQSEIVCVLFKDSYGIGGYLDRKVITGNLQDLIDRAAAFINLYLPVGAKIEGWHRVDLPELPTELLREALVNAVIHRDYSREGERIRILIYSDRVEIHSPGLLLPGITVGMMERGEVSSKLRNPRLAGLLRDIPRYTENIGSGVRLMITQSRLMGLPMPEFKELDEFVVIFRRPQKSEEADISLENAPLEKQIEIPVPEARDRESRLVLAMLYIQQNGFITNMEYRRLTGVSERVAARDLAMLVKTGALRVVGITRSRQYRLP